MDLVYFFVVVVGSTPVPFIASHVMNDIETSRGTRAGASQTVFRQLGIAFLQVKSVAFREQDTFFPFLPLLPLHSFVFHLKHIWMKQTVKSKRQPIYFCFAMDLNFRGDKRSDWFPFR